MLTRTKLWISWLVSIILGSLVIGFFFGANSTTNKFLTFFFISIMASGIISLLPFIAFLGLFEAYKYNGLSQSVIFRNQVVAQIVPYLAINTILFIIYGVKTIEASSIIILGYLVIGLLLLYFLKKSTCFDFAP